MPSDDESSELSSLSSLSPVPSDVELDDADSSGAEAESPKGILKFFSKKSAQPPKEPSPPPRKREPSPPHEYVLADNPDIAVRAKCPDIDIHAIFICVFCLLSSWSWWRFLPS